MKIAWLTGVALALVAPAASAQVVVAPDDAGKIVLRAASFDRNLAARAGKTVVIGVVSRAGDSVAAADGNEMAAAFRRLSDSPLLGLPVKVESWPVIRASELAEKLSATPAAVLYVTSGFDADELQRIAATAAASKALCTYRTPSYDGALPLGVLHREDRARLVINLAAAKQAGVDFDSQLLRLAVVK